MVRVFTAPTLSTVANVKNALEANGIPCVMRNERPGPAAGGLAPIETWPEVWVTSDADEERAREMIAEVSRPADDSAEPWRCAHCAEDVDAVFGKCWNCGMERPTDGEEAG
jgi:hypothetical protein